MEWNNLEASEQLSTIDLQSTNTPCLILKHSTRCSISVAAKLRLEKNWNFSSDQIKPYYLDLLEHRNISNEIAERYNVYHESPQILLISNGECLLDASHLDINVEEIAEVLQQVKI